jgi:peroxiredoxin Q/BCP
MKLKVGPPAAPERKHWRAGDKAPDFKLPDQDGKLHKLSDYSGKYVLLYFYPKDFTPGCTIEACELRNNFDDFKNLNVKVLGISTDSVESHKKFSERHKLPFTLLADENKKVVKLYRVWKPKKIFGKEILGTQRTSFLLDPDGKIVKIYERVRPKTHAEEVIKDASFLKA